MKPPLSFILEIAKIVIVALLVVIPVRYFLFQPFIVKGQSMEPTFFNGDYLIIDEISYRLFKSPQRGEVIVFKSPDNSSTRYIKRIIGLPGETLEIKNGKIIIYKDDNPQVLDESDYLSKGLETPGDLEISLDYNQYFVLGDNRFSSFDSRRFGSLTKENIVGRVYFRAWPFTAWAKIEAPAY